ncbi:MAG: ASCH domain-containing protein, partial [Lactococcus garvieae]
FGNNPQMADELLELVLEGKKRATASALSLYGPDDFLPAVDGRYEILLDGKGTPRAAIQTSKVYITKFNKVTEDHAFYEGEGDRSLAYWRQVHEAFFRDLDCYTPDMDIVCEEFEVLYKRS